MIRVGTTRNTFAAVLVTLAAVTIHPLAGAAFAAEGAMHQPPRTAAAAPESSGAFSLERCIEIALAENPEIAEAQWDITAAGSRLDAARSAFWPRLSVEGSYQRNLDDQRLVPVRYNGEAGVFDDDLMRGDLVAKMNLYSGGRISSEAGAAGKFLEAEKKKFIRSRDELIYRVTGVYFSILGQQKIIASLEISKKALRNLSMMMRHFQ